MTVERAEEHLEQQGTIRKRTVCVVGHKNPDTDSICSAIAYAYLEKQNRRQLQLRGGQGGSGNRRRLSMCWTILKWNSPFFWTISEPG